MITRRLNWILVCLVVGLMLSLGMQLLVAGTISCTSPCASASTSGSNACCGCGQASSSCVSCKSGEDAICENKDCDVNGTVGTGVCCCD
jgi:hypothetical protein